MKVSSCLQVAMAVAVSTSPAVARVIGDGNSAKAAVTLRDLGCNKSAINACVASSGEDSSFCFRHLCPGRPIESVTKRQEDGCTEENLLQCAILDWNEAQACFQQLCL